MISICMVEMTTQYLRTYNFRTVTDSTGAFGSGLSGYWITSHKPGIDVSARRFTDFIYTDDSIFSFRHWCYTWG